MKQLLPIGTTSSRSQAILVSGEIMYDSDQKAFFGGNGTTQGGLQFVTQDKAPVITAGQDSVVNITETQTSGGVVTSFDINVGAGLTKRGGQIIAEIKYQEIN